MKLWFSGIRSKLLMISFISVLSLLAVGVMEYTTVLTLTGKLNIAYNERAKITESLNAMESGIHASFRWLWAAYASEDYKIERPKLKQSVINEIAKVDRAIEVYLSLPIVPKARKLFQDNFIPNWNKSKNIINEIILELDKNSPEANDKIKILISKELRPSMAPVSQVLGELQETVKKVNAEILSETMTYAENSKIKSIVISSIAMFVCFIMCIYIANTLALTLTNVSNEIKLSGVNVSSSVDKIASSSDQLSQATIEQSSSLEEISSSVFEVNSMVSKNAENALKVSSSSEESHSSAKKGKEIVLEMISAINDISKSNELIMLQINQNNNDLTEIVKVIDDIKNKTNIINDIVFQTKILSFNASVESARAGENGKGFSVVAEEIGNLAQLSGKAANEISTMLASSILKVETIIEDSKNKTENLVQSGKSRVEHGNNIASECGVMLDEIVESVSKVKEMATDIAKSTQEQSQGVNEITKAIGQIHIATQINSTQAIESATAANDLSSQTVLLTKAVNTLISTVEGNRKNAA